MTVADKHAIITANARQHVAAALKDAERAKRHVEEVADRLEALVDELRYTHELLS